MAKVKTVNVQKMIADESEKLKKMGLRFNDETLELESNEEELNDDEEVNSVEDDADSLEIPKPPAEMMDFDEFLRWQRKLKPSHWNRMIVYVNRKHPAIDRTLSNPKNKKYIDKLVEPIDANYFEMMHGGGSYEMYVNEQKKGGSRTICKVRVKVPMEVEPILDLQELLVEHHLNRSYVNKLKRQGKLDNNLDVVVQKSNEEEKMDAMKDMQGQFLTLIKDMRDDEREMMMKRLGENKSEQSQAMMNMMMEASRASIDMVKEQSKGSQQDPKMMLEMVKMMKDIVAENRGNGQDGNLGMMFQWMMKQSELQNAMLMKLMETKAEPGGGMLDQVEKIISISKMINKGSEGGWVDKLIDKGGDILPNLLNVVNTAFMMKAGGQMQGGGLSQEQVMMMQQQQQMVMQQQQNGGGQVDQQKLGMARELVSQYGGFVAMKLAQGKTGEEFAAELYETFSPGIFEQSIREPIGQVGVENFVMAVMENPQLQLQVMNVMGTKENFEQWCNEFMKWSAEGGEEVNDAKS